jgi:2-polyprenyl-3-methyl-5-hydroxy-6-metoxy-1,4-benzoquinol methylase
MSKQLFYDKISEQVEDQGYNIDKIQFICSSVDSGLRVLDIGCNNGFIGEMLIKNGNEVYGVDIGRAKVHKAIARGLKARVVDIENNDLPYKANYFDIILLTDVIEHVFDTDMLINKIYRVLKHGGKLLITTPNVASLARRFMLLLGFNPFLEYSTSFIDFVPSPVGHIRYYTHSDLRRQLERHHFQNVRTKGDRVNFLLFSSPFIASLFPSLSVDIHCIGIK